MYRTELRHVVLYAKHWYKHSQDIWADIKKCLSADGYSGEYFNEGDCVSVILHRYEDLTKGRDCILTDTIFAIQPHNTWRFGYYTKGNSLWFTRDDAKELPEYSVNEAIVRFCLSHFAGLDEEQWNVGAPDFKNCLPKADDVTNKKVKEMFGHLKE